MSAFEKLRYGNNPSYPCVKMQDVDEMKRKLLMAGVYLVYLHNRLEYVGAANVIYHDAARFAKSMVDRHPSMKVACFISLPLAESRLYKKILVDELLPEGNRREMEAAKKLTARAPDEPISQEMLNRLIDAVNDDIKRHVPKATARQSLENHLETPLGRIMLMKARIQKAADAGEWPEAHRLMAEMQKLAESMGVT